MRACVATTFRPWWWLLFATWLHKNGQGKHRDKRFDQSEGKGAGVTALLQVNNLQTHFFTSNGVVKAVDGISYEVKPGETVAIVGESGSGKSVGAMSILRLIPNPPGKVVGGEINFDGRNLLDLDEDGIRNVRGKDIGMIFQEPMTSLNPVLSIGRQLTETLEGHLGWSREKCMARAKELLSLVGISEPDRRLQQYPHHLSGGMRQRVMIAMALACEPKLIIADEPTTALDVTIQAQILELMKNLTRQMGVAMIVITHNLGVVARYADRVNVMYAGRIVESGPAREIYEDPRHPYTLALLRSVPRMDLPRGMRLEPVDGQPPDLTKLDDGCSFRPRCRFTQPHCGQSRPELVVVGNDHISACFEQDRLGASVAVAHGGGA